MNPQHIVYLILILLGTGIVIAGVDPLKPQIESVTPTYSVDLLDVYEGTYETKLIKYDNLYNAVYSTDGMKVFTKMPRDFSTVSYNYEIREYHLQEPFNLKGALFNDSLFITSDDSDFIYDGLVFAVGDDTWLCSLEWDISTCTHTKHFDSVTTGNMLARALIAPTIALTSGETLDVDYSIHIQNMEQSKLFIMLLLLFAVVSFNVTLLIFWLVPKPKDDTMYDTLGFLGSITGVIHSAYLGDPSIGKSYLNDYYVNLEGKKTKYSELPIYIQNKLDKNGTSYSERRRQSRDD